MHASQTRRNAITEDHLGFQITLMYGRYTKDLGAYAKEEAQRIRVLEKQRKYLEKQRTKELRKYRGRFATKCFNLLHFVWARTIGRLGDSWVFLATLGVIMAFLSFVVDCGISMCNQARIWLYRDLATHPLLQYLAWICFPIFLVLFAAGFSHIVAPQSIGSGIPEMKTVIRGVVLKEYLTFRTLVAKIVGLTASLGSGMPLGKEGPFVHISSLVASSLSKVFSSFKDMSDSKSYGLDMLAAACAVGVGSCFAAPIGGVLFSIEVTAVYFAVRNYWQGFFASVCGATVFRLLSVWFQSEETVTAVYRTHFRREFPYDPQELCVFAIMGVISGLGGALFVLAHRKYVLFMRRNKKMNSFLQKNRFIYPGLVAFTVSSLTFPLGLGQFLAADVTFHEQVYHLFSNFTWAKSEHTVDELEVISHWATPYSNIYLSLGLYAIVSLLLTIVAVTLPVPCGLFIPVFRIGAALGRLIGECMATWFPNGSYYGGANHLIVPGGYAIAGAAAFSGAVTHSISVAVIVFEMTGQIVHAVPVMIAVLLANAVAQYLQPSIYDSIIQIKRLPYLPELLSNKPALYTTRVEDIMVREVFFVWNGMSFRLLRSLLRENRKLRSFPLVDSKDSMILLGSIQRCELVSLLERHIGKEKRMHVAEKWQRAVGGGCGGAISSSEPPSAMPARKFPRPRGSGGDDDDHGGRRRTREARSASTSRSASPEGRAAQQGEPPPPAAANRHSRFHVVSVPSSSPPRKESKETPLFYIRRNSSVDDIWNAARSSGWGAYSSFHSSRGRPPIKSILKKTSSFVLSTEDQEESAKSNATTPRGTSPSTPRESRLGQFVDTLMRKASSLRELVGSENYKKVTLPRERIIDMSPEDQRLWEEEELQKLVDFGSCHIDPAPFQLVERTSLLKVHSLFSLLGLQHAYVTAIGKLVGVVSLKELRLAIEKANTITIPLASLKRSPLNVDPESANLANVDSDSSIPLHGDFLSELSK